MITLVLLWITYVSHRWDITVTNITTREDANKYTQSKIFSAAGTSCILTIYVWILDVFAFVFLEFKPPILQKKDLDERVLPILAFVFDSVLNIAWVFLWFMACCSSWTLKSKKYKYIDNKEYNMFLAFSAASSVLAFIVHMPYIAIAYLNEAL